MLDPGRSRRGASSARGQTTASRPSGKSRPGPTTLSLECGAVAASPPLSGCGEPLSRAGVSLHPALAPRPRRVPTDEAALQPCRRRRTRLSRLVGRRPPGPRRCAGESLPRPAQGNRLSARPYRARALLGSRGGAASLPVLADPQLPCRGDLETLRARSGATHEGADMATTEPDPPRRCERARELEPLTFGSVDRGFGHHFGSSKPNPEHRLAKNSPENRSFVRYPRKASARSTPAQTTA